MIREELKRLFTWEERHRRLLSRLVLVVILTLGVDAIGTVLVYVFERNVASTDIHSVFDAFFFTTVQLLTVSSQIKNPLSVPGRVIDICLEIWAVLVVAGSAGASAITARRGLPRMGAWRLLVTSGCEPGFDYSRGSTLIPEGPLVAARGLSSL